MESVSDEEHETGRLVAQGWGHEVYAVSAKKQGPHYICVLKPAVLYYGMERKGQYSLRPGVANCGPGATSDLPPVSGNQVTVGRSHACSASAV